MTSHSFGVLMRRSHSHKRWSWTSACAVAWCLCLCISSGVANAQAVPSAAEVADLPLTWVAPKGPTVQAVAVVLTGDGGWAELVRKIADGLASEGVAVVGFNSRAWLSSPKTPAQTATAVVRAIQAAQRRWPSSHVVVVGYSRGADFAPFVANRLPPALAAQLAGVAMFGLAPNASFEFHWSDLVKDTQRDTDIPTLPELLKLRAVRMVCVYGQDEAVSGCRNAPSDLLIKDARDGGHHFDGDVNALVQHVMNLLK